MGSTNLNSTLEINRIADVDNDRLIFIQEVKKGEELERRTLIFDPKRCSGCCVCVYSCPVNAIQFAGYEMLMAGMPLIIDHTTCVFCGICFALCPDRAFDFKVGNESNVGNADSEIKSVFFKLKGGALKLDECVDCLICPTVCPAEAVNFRILTKIDDLHERSSGVKGKLKIDTEKCKLCGICTAFCDALVAVENTDKFKPFSEILLREERCDFCGLCEYVCPNQAIKVESKERDSKANDKEIKVLEVEFTDKCIECGICELACPYEGVKVEKSFEGEIDVLWNRLDKFCDVESCKACINVCKSKAWELSEGKLELNTELCRFCRACANVCPEKLIDVKLSNINVEWLDSERPGGWLKAVERVLKECTVEIRKLKFESLEGEGERGGEETQEVSEKFELKTGREKEEEKELEKLELKSKLDALRKILKNPGYRRMFETRPEKFLNSVKNLRG